MEARAAYIAMNLIEGLGPVRVRALVEALGSPQAVLDAPAEALAQAERVGPELARAIVERRAAADPAAEEERARRLGARIVAFPDPDYPAPLRKIHDPPLALYVRGTLTERDRHALAMVGTRQATHYGLGVADRFAYQLARVGFTVVSGLARGIDTAAHRGALKGGGRTIAVLGSALDQLYPPENAELADQVARQGAVISEYAIGRPADRTTFPYRNRIVSGLAMGVLVVEAGLNSGALLTADVALEQGRSVFAVPGRIDAPSARGAHRLIQGGARLVEDLDDILQEFEFLLPPEKKSRAAALDPRPRVELTADEQAVVRALWAEPLDMDTLIRRTALPAARVNSLMIGLEMKRVVRMLPGRVVQLADGLKDACPAERDAGAGRPLQPAQ